MKNCYPWRFVLAMAFGLLGSLTSHGDVPAFEEISVLQTEFEPWWGMVNRGDGYFYGVARWSEQSQGGVVYRLAPGKEAQVLHKFPTIADDTVTNSGGSNPSCGLVLGADGSFYGATELGGFHAAGTIYRISPDGIYSVIHQNRASDGYDIHSLVATPDGSLYGTMEGGEFGGGVIFRIDPEGDFQTVYSFHLPDYGTPWDPVVPGLTYGPFYPWHLALGTDGKLYGTTESGGPVNRSGFFKFTYGTVFRYDGPGAITELCNFDSLQSHPSSITATTDGFYVSTEHHLAHVALNGMLTVKTDFLSLANGDGPSIFMGKPLVMPDGVYGQSFYGGANNSGFVYRHIPGGATEVLHDFAPEYRGRSRCLMAGNDGLVYGLAAFPKGYQAPVAAGPTRTPTPAAAGGPRTYRFRKDGGGTSNFVPVAKPDVVVLPVNPWKSGRRKLVVDVLANDFDPDLDPLAITGVTVVGTASARMIPTDAGPRLQIVTEEVDPPSQLVTYQLADGHGGTSTGYVAVRSPAGGSYTGEVSKKSKPSPAIGQLAVEISKENSITATFFLYGRTYIGKGKLDIQDSSNLTLISKGKSSKLLHIDLTRAGTREIKATIEGNGTIYTGTCKMLSGSQVSQRKQVEIAN